MGLNSTSARFAWSWLPDCQLNPDSPIAHSNEFCESTDKTQTKENQHETYACTLNACWFGVWLRLRKANFQRQGQLGSQPTRSKRLGWLLGIGALAIPGVGPFIAAGPIMAALAGTAIGGAAGGISGALIGLGIPEYEAKKFEGKLKGERCLVSVHSESAEET